MTHHPYKSQPNTAFWARAVSVNWDPGHLLPNTTILKRDDKIASLGSCFASNLVPYLVENGFVYVQEEKRHPLFARAPAEHLAYDKFSAAYGNIYTTRQFSQLLDRALGLWHPKEDRWEIDGKIVDPFRPGLRYAASTHIEFDVLTSQHLASVKRVFTKANVIIFTLGLTEAWCSKSDGAVFPACPGTIAGSFDPDKYVFRNFTVREIVDDLRAIYLKLKVLKSEVQLILTVSPVPLVATATGSHVLSASIYSKSVLRVACGEICHEYPDIIYFPSYEIITGPQAPDDFFEADKRNVSKRGIDEVMRVFLSHCETDPGSRQTSLEQPVSVESRLSEFITHIECEEAAAEL